ncbi:2Fe-2S iron-sulfur cluster-binding protein [Rhizorhabdus dicambivorans]|uniref:2Fe-2S ferredoxin n=1 Tax=Rhizorhabdus dicambivorans TaxID=1850238 RepID=A0A2A4G0L5_9SPHN|nr:2Fe-2S iron-sulfur cluster-binding protein [Rhizorhabdus dicambivorans]ATE66510.1 2Fe-2S ferredoxin [Rhizorhabdus dicambivorans]PCE44008.1 2Fe-2S ferredoxin [Rhizorhabdus dicambivorans]
MARITFVEFDGTEHPVEADDGYTVMEVALDNDVPGIEAECGGAGACATCHIYIDRDWTAVAGEAGPTERELLEMVEDRRAESRLSCQINIRAELDGMVVRLPEVQGF